MTIKNFIFYWLPVFALMGVIFCFSSMHSVQVTPTYWTEFAFKKNLHFFEYGLLSLLMYRALVNTTRLPKQTILWLSWSLATLYGASDELHQTFVPTREGRLRDVFIDSSGAATAMLALNFLLPKAKHPWLRTLVRLLDIKA